MKRPFILSLLLCWGILTFGQNYPSAGLLRAQATFAVGKDVWLSGAKPYLFTEFEGMPDDHVGIAGTVLVQLSRNELNDQPDTLSTWSAETHHVLFGPMWHFTPDQPLDVHLGLQPGFSAILVRNDLPASESPTLGIAPAVCGTAGIAYYGSFFHVFAQAKFITGYQSGMQYRGALTEGMVTAGLGWNIDVQK